MSVSSDGDQADYESLCPSVSADGRYVAFYSWATNLVSGDTNGYTDVFVHDRRTGRTELVTVADHGAQADWDSFDPSISADGRCVAFVSHAANLVGGDANGVADVFVRDLEAGQLERVSVASDGSEGNGDSFYPAISADGRVVAFCSFASNLVPEDTNGQVDVFVRDRETGQTERVSVASDGTEADGNSDSRPAISGDGRYVAFSSWASNLVAGDTNYSMDVFLRDRTSAQTERVSVSSDGAQAHGNSAEPSISYDGQRVAFYSHAGDLVGEDTNRTWDVFVRDRLAKLTERGSVASEGTQADGPSGSAWISLDGRYVAFHSAATNLVPGDTNDLEDVFLHDCSTGQTERVSVAGESAQGNGATSLQGGLSVSVEGRCIAFCSNATNLVRGDTNARTDVFVRDLSVPGFADVPLNHWAHNEVAACLDANVVKGYPDGLYHPSDAVTRDQMAVYVARALVVPIGDARIPDPGSAASFLDVPPTYWAYKHVEYAVAQNVVRGYADGSYRPSTELDRGQMAAFIARAMLAPRGDSAIPDPIPPSTFPDARRTFWAHEYVEYCASRGVVQGYPDGLYHPEYPCTRDQMAVYVARAFGLL